MNKNSQKCGTLLPTPPRTWWGSHSCQESHFFFCWTCHFDELNDSYSCNNYFILFVILYSSFYFVYSVFLFKGIWNTFIVVINMFSTLNVHFVFLYHSLFFFFYSKIHSVELLGGRSRVFCGTRILWHIWPSSHLSEQESSENYLALLSFSHSDTHRSLSRWHMFLSSRLLPSSLGIFLLCQSQT